MKTTELYIEQVIIGFLVLAIAALPWTREWTGHLGDINLAEGSVLLGVAFLLGIPFDRLADTLSERLDRHHRLQFALDQWEGSTFPATKPDNEKLEKDLFAEDEYRLQGLRDEDAVVNWIEYHRSRIRLARALAVYGPALTLSFTLSMRSDPGLSRLEIGICLGAVAGYIVWGIVASHRKRQKQQTDSSHEQNKPANPRDSLKWLFGPELPRTDDALFLQYAKDRNRIDCSTRQVREAPRAVLRVLRDEWRILVIPVAVLVTAFALGFSYNAKTAWVAVCGALVTVISAWSWWRISSTYRAYLFNLTRH